MSGARVILEGPGKFDYGAADLRAEWKRWKRGFNSWLIGAEQDGKKEAVKLNLLLTLLGSNGQDIYETFEWSDTNRNLEGALQRFDSHFAGLSNVTMTRFRFFSFVQGGMSVTDFVTGLKSLANDCEFGDLRDSLVKDMIVIHCSSEKLRERLLKESKLDLTNAVDIARVAEEAERNVDTISRGTESGGTSALAAGRKSGSAWSKAVSDCKYREQFDGECFECGEYGHRAIDCRERKRQVDKREYRRDSSSRSSGNDDVGKRTSRAGYAVSFALRATVGNRSKKGWYVDSGASQHMTSDRGCFEWYEPYRTPRKVTLGDGRWVKAYGQGETMLKVSAAGGVALVSLGKVQFVPKLQASLLSIPATTKIGNQVRFQRQICEVSCGSLRLMCPINGDGLYEVPTLSDPESDRCANSGGVKMNPAHQHVQHRETTDGFDYGKRTRMAGSSGTKTTVGGGSRFEDHLDSTSMERRRPRYQEHPDLWTMAGGQGYPGASSRNGPKAGGQGYPGARFRNGMQ